MSLHLRRRHRAVGDAPGGSNDPVAADALFRRVRWVGAPLTALQFIVYSPPSGQTMPFSRWWGLLPVALIIGINLAGAVRSRRPDQVAATQGWAIFQLVWDSAVTMLLIGMFAFDDSSALWALLIIPVLEAATRGWQRRALGTFAVLCVGYIVREVAASMLLPSHQVTVDSVSYRLGLLSIVATSTAGLAGRLTRQILDTAAAQAEADQLRAVAVATRRMSSLDVPTVVREVTHAAETLGFTSVQLRSRAGAVLGSEGVRPAEGRTPQEWFERTAAAAGPAGYAVLEGDDAGAGLGEGEVLVVATVAAGDVIEALLVGCHTRPLQGLAESLTLLAAQASAALANALRYEEGRAFEERLAHQATHDALTGLPNRTLLRDRARAAVARSRRGQTLVAVMFVDLDRFKEINDVLGHAVGDALLQSVADRVVRQLRPEDTCARVGGDEFVVVAADQPDEHAVLALAQRLLTAIHEPFLIEGVSVDIEASVGVAWAPGHGDDVDELLRCADVAMYAAKNRQEGVVVYQTSDDQLTPVHLATLGDLRRALDSPGQLVPAFQPIIDLATDRLVGVEALVRWNHPSRGLVVPDDFIPLAERTAVIHQITDHVLDQALGALHCWLEQGLDIQVAVNLSARTLLDVSLSQRLESLLSCHGVAADRLRLEITESTLVADPTRAIATMHRLNDLGVRLSIDDFGTGYSSMSYLKSLPVDEIKIDRSFVTDMVRSPRDCAMVRSVIDLAHTLRLRVVAEGVEDGPTLDALAFIGCDLAQGFHVGRPMPAKDLVAWAEEHHRSGSRREPDLVTSVQQF